MKKSRKLAWVVLGVVALAVLATGIASWRSLLYEELETLTNQPVHEGWRHEFSLTWRNETPHETLELFSLERTGGSSPSSRLGLTWKSVLAYEWPLSYVVVLKNRITSEVRIIALDLDGRQAGLFVRQAGFHHSPGCRTFPYTKAAGP